jgi:hypothetical protein
MKLEYRLMLGVAIFLAGTGAIYEALIETSSEVAGTVMLVFGGFAYAILFGYILLQYLRRHRIPRPEDAQDAKSEDGAGEVSFFPSASVWPAAMGLGFVLMGVGLVYGVWYLVIGGITFVGAIIGFSVEAEARN